jgi:hypothetical protein
MRHGSLRTAAVPVKHGTDGASTVSKILRVAKEEFRHMLPPVIFFAISFNLILFTMNLIMADYAHRLGSFLVATTAALVVGKAVLVADVMPFLRRFDTAPLIRPILFKAVVYWLFVLAARLIEAVMRYLIEMGGIGGFLPFMAEQFSWDHFLFIQIWILVLFLIYVTASELNSLFGDGELYRILFTRRSTELKLSRRQRIRTLVRLSRLTGNHSTDELADRRTRVHRELLALLRALAADPPDRSESRQDATDPAAGSPAAR